MTTNIHDSIDKKVAEVKSVWENLNSFPTKLEESKPPFLLGLSRNKDINS